MGQKKYPFHRTITLAAVAGTNLLKDDQVGPLDLVCYQRVAVINETNPYTRLRLTIQRVGPTFLISEEANPRVDQLYWDDVAVYLTEGEIYTAELTGCSASDVLKMYVTGWEQENGSLE